MQMARALTEQGMFPTAEGRRSALRGREGGRRVSVAVVGVRGYCGCGWRIKFGHSGGEM